MILVIKKEGHYYSPIQRNEVLIDTCYTWINPENMTLQSEADTEADTKVRCYGMIPFI